MIRIDMQMPEGCSECRFETECRFCKAMPDNFCGYTNDEGRPEWCPLKEQEEVVRCKDCKHLEHIKNLDEINGKECYVCRKHIFTGMRSPDWFCADGERR